VGGFKDKEASSQQKLGNAASLNLDIKPRQIKSNEMGTSVDIDWEDSHSSTFSSTWLLENCYSSPELTEEKRQKVLLWDNQLLSQHGLPTMNYRDLLENDHHLWNWFKFLSSIGICKVTDVPSTEAGLIAVARRLGRLKESMYNIVDHVYFQPDPSNVAYTCNRLEPHMDLCYYESVPGIQILHCMEYKSSGGENFFVDSFKVAETLRATNPSAFDTLTKYSNGFHKVDKQNHRIFRRTPIVVDDYGEIVGVNYSPPFEAPLKIPFESVIKFYTAHKGFATLLNDPKYFFHLQLREGDLVSFNNRRVLHAREAFSPNGARHILTCYVDTDEFSSNWKMLQAKFGENILLPRIGSFTY